MHSAPRYSTNEGVAASLGGLLGHAEITEANGEIAIHVAPADLIATMTALRGDGYQQLMEIAGVDWLGRAPRFEVVYMLLSVTRNHRVRVHIAIEAEQPVPSVTGLWPVAGWLEREVFDLYGLLFEGNTDLRRILTDYGFTGHPLRKDFPQTGYVELRYSEEEKRVKYEPVKLAQGFRTFDFLSPWEGAEYALPGDEKAIKDGGPVRGTPPKIDEPKVTEKPAETGAGAAANREAKKRTVSKKKTAVEVQK